MRKLQKLFFMSFLLITALEVLLLCLYNTSAVTRYVEFGGSILLFAVAFFTRKKSPEQQLLLFAFLFSAIGDFFFALYPMLFRGSKGILAGIACFMFAYVFLILAFHSKSRSKFREAALALPFLGTVAFFFFTMHLYITGIMVGAAAAFSVVIVCMAWTCTNTLLRGHFSRKPTRFVSAASILIFASDLAVAYAVFYPPFAAPPLWLLIFIRSTYVPAWTLLLMVTMENNLKISGGVHPS